MAWEKFDNIKGPKGDKGTAGTIGSVSAETVAAGEPARASITGVEDVHLHLELPRGAKGDQGPPGVASSASAKSVGADQAAKVILSQHGELVHMELEIPRGAPGTNGVATAEAIGQNLAMPDSAARPGLETGMGQVAEDPASEFAKSQKAKLDAGLSGKANLVGGKVPDAEIGAAQTATSGTVPKRTTSGRLPGIGAPTGATDATPKAYVDAGITSAVTPVATQVTAMEGVMLTKDDLMITTIISGTADGATFVPETVYSHYNKFFVAPFPLRILSATLMFSRPQDASTSSKNFNLALRRFRSGAGAQIVEKTTWAEAIVTDTAWSFDGATWNEANRVLQAGDGLGFGGSVAGGAKLTYPVAVTVRFARVIV